MPNKEESPLQTLSKESSTLKKKIDKSLDACQKALKLKDNKSPDKGKKTRELFNELQEHKTEIEALHRRAQKLTIDDEPSKVSRYDSKKKDEIKKLDTQKDRLEKMCAKLEPVMDKETPSKGKNGEAIEESEEEESEEEDYEEEDSEEEEEEYEDDEVEGDVEDEEVEDEEVEDEEEEEEEDEEEGDSEGEEEESEEEEDEETDEEEGTFEANTGTMRQYIALTDFEGETPDDLGFHEGEILTIISAREDGWLEAENSKGKKGLVPITYLKVHNTYKEAAEESEGYSDEEPESPGGKTPRSGRVLWKNIKKAVKETSVTDVLHAMGALPTGFRKSTLASLYMKEMYKMQNYLIPKLSPSCVSYRDLFCDPNTNRIRTRKVRIQRIIQLSACRQIPLPGAGVEITSRHIRICLFDGKKMLSNIHTVRVSSVDKEQRTWNFNNRASENMKSLEFGDVFVRTSSTEGRIGVLFELCMSYIRTTTGQESEFSCGWVHMPLFDEEGAPIANKTYDLLVHGGTPFEKGVDVDPSVGRRAESSLFRSLMAGNRQPRLVARVQAPTKDQKELLDTLPEVLLSNTSYIQYLSFYRQILCDALVGDRLDQQSAEPIHNPLLTCFPAVVEQHDLMDVLRAGWAERLKTAKRAEKRDQESQKELFVKVFMEYVYPLYHSASLPSVKFGSLAQEQERVAEMQRLLKIGRDKKLMMASLLSSEAIHKPFDITELSFNVIGPYCTQPLVDRHGVNYT